MLINNSPTLPSLRPTLTLSCHLPFTLGQDQEKRQIHLSARSSSHKFFGHLTWCLIGKEIFESYIKTKEWDVKEAKS